MNFLKQDKYAGIVCLLLIAANIINIFLYGFVKDVIIQIIVSVSFIAGILMLSYSSYRLLAIQTCSFKKTWYAAALAQRKKDYEVWADRDWDLVHESKIVEFSYDLLLDALHEPDEEKPGT